MKSEGEEEKNLIVLFVKTDTSQLKTDTNQPRLIIEFFKFFVF